MSILSLSRIFLHNWHRFSHHVIDVEDSLYFAGHNGSGKSSVLDAIQLVLIADGNRVRYNSSAQERSARTLETYVRGKIGEDRLLRPGNTVAYIALEFTNRAKASHVTIGVCIEAGEQRSTERSFFILGEPLDPGLLVPDGRPTPRRELRQLLKNRRGAQAYDNVGEYQDDMRNRLGGLNERFFDLFLRALTFQPIRNIDEFVEQWLLEARPLDVAALQQVVDRFSELQTSARLVEEKLAALKIIGEHQGEVRRLHERRAEYTLLAALLRLVAAQRRRANLEHQHTELTAAISRASAQWEQAAAALEGARKAQLEAEVNLRQSDVIRRRDDLKRQIERATREAEQIRAVWDALRNDLQREAQALATLRQHPDTALSQLVERLHDLVAGLAADQPPPAELAELLDTVVQTLDAALVSAQEQRFELDRQVKALHARVQELDAELRRLQSDKRLTYNPALERLRVLINEAVGVRSFLLCELLEIPDEQWQNAVEAMLGPRRFNLIVPPEHFEASLAVLDRARAAERIYDVGLIDLGKARNEARPAQVGSLAQQVQAKSKLIQSYIDTVLGDIMICETVAELRRSRRAVTPEVVVYGEWTARAIPPERYQPWFIGERAQRSQIESRRNELAEINRQLETLVPQLEASQQRVEQLNRGRPLSNLRQRLDMPLDARPFLAEIASYREELATLDLSGVAALEAEVARLRELVDREQRAERDLNTQRGRLEGQLPALQDERRRADVALADAEQQANDARNQLAPAIPAAEALLAERREQPDLAEAVRNAETTAARFRTQADNAVVALTKEASEYNTRYQFAALASNPDETRYLVEQERLAATELPQFAAQIAQAQTEAEEELREHVLHRLREQVLQARQKLEWINDALGKLTFHGERYRFRATPSEALRAYYELISDSELLGSGSLFESEFYQRHKTTFDRFYEQLTRMPQTDAEKREQDRLVDYRRYLSYDIEITHADGRTSRLSRIMGQTSGGETQTPFYLTIAASFVQLYHIGERTSRPMIRLVAFDEAFSKMDQDRIGATLDLFQRFGLQIITATPLERCEYVVPKICTSLVLSAVGDSVWVEPYRNYAARLEDGIDGDGVTG